MGMAIFTKSGLFDPASRGLSVGDTVDVIVVGGGQGGVSANSGYAGNGGSSSFGTEVTARGGGVATSGWAKNGGGFTFPAFGNDTGASIENSQRMYGSGAGYSAAYRAEKFHCGAAGWGAAGGYADSDKTGSAGEVIFGSVTLASLDKIPVTVGGGGGGGSYSYRGSGEGASGSDGTSSGGGAGGATNLASGGAGGYDMKPGGNAAADGNSDRYGLAGGGGAGGVVIVFW